MSFIRGLARGWHGLWDLIRLTRFNFILIVLAYLILFVPDQGRELALSSGDSGNITTTRWFIFAVCWWAIQSWYWARLTFELEFSRNRERWKSEAEGSDFERRSFWIANLPRFYALAVFAMGYYFLLVGQNPYAEQLAIIAAIIYVGFIIRVPFLKVFGLYKSEEVETPQERRFERYRQMRMLLPGFSLVFFRSSLLISLILIGLVAMYPVFMGTRLGAAAIAFLAFGSFVPIGSYLIILSHRLERIPVLASIVLAVAVFSPFNDNHMIRPHESNMGIDKFVKSEELDQRRLSLSTALTRWLESRNSLPVPGQTPYKPIPIVFVSTAGGGMPAAYWTTTVLGRLQDDMKRNPRVDPKDQKFSDHVFSISGVSGGSVGAAIFLSLLDHPEADKNWKDCDERLETLGRPVLDFNATDTAIRGQAILCSDLLGPAVAALLYQDVIQQFVPFGIVKWPRDRAYAIERAMEMAWENVHGCEAHQHDAEEVAHNEGEGGQDDCAVNNPLRQKFLDLWCDANDDTCWQSKGWRPQLLLNGTHEETGKRIITSKLSVDNNTFTDSYDLYALSNYHISLSTAAHNSARFPVISPAGGLWIHEKDGPEDKRLLALLSSKRRTGHVLDGGYFENNGTETTKDIALRVFDTAQFGDPKSGLSKFWIKPIFIEIVNSADAQSEELERRLDKNGRCLTPGIHVEASSKLPTFDGYDRCQDVDQENAEDSLCAQGLNYGTGPIFNEVLAPVNGIFSTRSARGIQSAKNLVEQACRVQRSNPRVASAVFAQFRICRNSETDKPGLGWRLSTNSRELMKYHLIDMQNDEQARENIEKLMQILSTKSQEDLNPRNLEQEFMDCMADNAKAHKAVMDALETTLNWGQM